jgi:hypothetical protein
VIWVLRSRNVQSGDPNRLVATSRHSGHFGPSLANSYAMCGASVRGGAGAGVIRLLPRGVGVPRNGDEVDALAPRRRDVSNRRLGAFLTPARPYLYFSLFLGLRARVEMGGPPLSVH